MINVVEIELSNYCGGEIKNATNEQLYLALLQMVQKAAEKKVQPVEGRKLYYISAEFLIGKLLSNNLINLGLYEEVKE